MDHDINAAGQAIRRPHRFGDVVKVTGASPDHADPRGTTIDVSHETLIRRSTRIAAETDGWLQREFRDGLI